MRRLRLAWPLLAVVFGACLFEPGRPTRPWRPACVTELPRCASAADGISIAEASGRPKGERVRVRGQLDISGWRCTKMGCEDRWGRELECCNGCSTSIFMKDPAGAGERVFLRRGGELRRFGMGARDCALRMFDKTPLERWFVAEGIVEEDDHEVLYVQDEDGTERIKPGPKAILLVEATLCTWEGKLPAPPRP